MVEYHYYLFVYFNQTILRHIIELHLLNFCQLYNMAKLKIITGNRKTTVSRAVIRKAVCQKPNETLN